MSTLTEHKYHVHQVLQALLDAKLFVKAEKCLFHANTVTFLGFLVSEGTVHMDPDKVVAVLKWPVSSVGQGGSAMFRFCQFLSAIY